MITLINDCLENKMPFYYCGYKGWRGYMNRITEAKILDALPFGKPIAKVRKHEVYFVCRSISKTPKAIMLKKFWCASRIK